MIGIHKRDTAAAVHLDAVRGLAALSVFASHLRAIFFVSYEDVHQKNVFVKALYLLSGSGHEAVMVFFVLSGFFISSSVLRAVQQDRWDWKSYAQNRLTRLYVVLIPALLLGALWDHLGMKTFGQEGIYAGLAALQGDVATPIAQLVTLPTWLGNLFFLQKIVVPPFGSNAALWSLSYEFWYYLLFPFALLALWPKSMGRARLLYAALALLAAAFVGKTIALYFLIWLMGTALSAAPPSRWGQSKIFLGLSFAAFVAMLAASRLRLIHLDVLDDFLIGITFSALVYALLHRQQAVAGKVYKAAAQFASQTSYSLYLVHLPILVFSNAWIIGSGRLWQPDARHLGIGALVAAGTLLYTCLIWSFTEANTDRLRKALVASWPAPRWKAEIL